MKVDGVYHAAAEGWLIPLGHSGRWTTYDQLFQKVNWADINQEGQPRSEITLNSWQNLQNHSG